MFGFLGIFLIMPRKQLPKLPKFKGKSLCINFHKSSWAITWAIFHERIWSHWL
jgi:hypothetical protein